MGSFSFKKLFSMLIILTAFMMFSVSAQETEEQNKIWLESGFGINFFGPAPQMAELMIEYNFDQTTTSWLTGETIEHPHYSSFGPSVQLSFSYYLSPRSRLGMLVQYAWLREVFGYHVSGDYLFIRFSNFSFVPLYSINLGRSWEVQAGPAIMINTGNRSDSYYSQPESNFTRLSPALHCGLSLRIWDSKIIYGKISSQGMLTYRNNMGPYKVESWDGSILTIPESKIGFSYLNFLFVLGAHF
jgi:hypothetical protein